MAIVNPGDVGKEAKVIDEETVEKYADLIGDFNPLHVDRDYAEDAVFGGRIGHATLTNGIVSAAITDLPGDKIFIEQSVSFENPVYLGEQVEATAEVKSVQGTLKAELDLIAKVGEKQILSGTATILSVDATDKRLERLI